MGFRVEKDLMIPMRDGVALATDLFLPDGGPAPVLLVRMAYDKNVFEKMAIGMLPSTLSFVEAGYAVVWQDCRGSFGSDGTYRPSGGDADDGADTVAWILEQPWCDGNIGSYGASYLGLTQWATASRHPAGLKAIAPMATSPDSYAAPWYSQGGALSWGTVFGWLATQTLTFGMYALRHGKGDAAVVTEAGGMWHDRDRHLAKLPISDQPTFDTYSPWWREWLDHPARDAFWTDLASSEHFAEMAAPALHVVGWFDFFADPTARAFARLRAEAATAGARDGQRLVIGPWDHLYQDGEYRDRAFGPAGHYSAVDSTGMHLRFFDRHLRGNTAADIGATPVRIFVMGIDEWRDEQDWPLPDTTYVAYHLDGSGHANTAAGDGLLTTEAPTTEAVDTTATTRPIPSRRWAAASS